MRKVRLKYSRTPISLSRIAKDFSSKFCTKRLEKTMLDFIENISAIKMSVSTVKPLLTIDIEYLCYIKF